MSANPGLGVLGVPERRMWQWEMAHEALLANRHPVQRFSAPPLGADGKPVKTKKFVADYAPAWKRAYKAMRKLLRRILHPHPKKGEPWPWAGYAHGVKEPIGLQRRHHYKHPAAWLLNYAYQGRHALTPARERDAAFAPFRHAVRNDIKWLMRRNLEWVYAGAEIRVEWPSTRFPFCEWEAVQAARLQGLTQTVFNDNYRRHRLDGKWMRWDWRASRDAARAHLSPL